MAVQKTNTQNLSSLIINKVDSKDTFQSMVTNNLVNANELYLVQSELGESSEVFTVEFAMDDEPITSNKTYNEIINAINNKIPIYAIASDDTTSMDLSCYFWDDTIEFISNIYIPQDWSDPICLKIIYNSNGTIDFDYIFLQNTNATLTIGSYTYNGSSAVNIPVYDGTYTWG